MQKKKLQQKKEGGIQARVRMTTQPSHTLFYMPVQPGSVGFTVGEVLICLQINPGDSSLRIKLFN